MAIKGKKATEEKRRRRIAAREKKEKEKFDRIAANFIRHSNKKEEISGRNRRGKLVVSMVHGGSQ